MILDDYIKYLELLRKTLGRGDVEVEKWMPAKGRHAAPAPAIAYARRHQRGDVPAFYNPPHDNEVQKAHAVIRI